MTTSLRTRCTALLLAVATACGGGGSSGSTGGPGGGGPVVVPEPPAELDSVATGYADDLRAQAGTPEAIDTVRWAIHSSGFDVVNSDGTLDIEARTPANGLSFEATDPALLAGQLVKGVMLPLDDLLAAWSSGFPGVTVDAMRRKLVEDLRLGAVSTARSREFWAAFVVHLGRTAPVPYDLLDYAVPGSALLDPVQVALLSYVYQGELWAAGQRAAGRLQASPAAGTPLRAAAPTPRPCTMTDTESTVMDVAALAGSTWMGQVIGYAAETVPAAEKLGKFAGAANAVLTVVKLLWTFYAFDAKVEMAGGMLVRHADGTAGEARTFTGTFKYDTGNAQVLNCVRPALNAVGIDFSLPQDGPIADAKVDWELFGAKDRRPGKLPIVRFGNGEVQLGGRTDAAGVRQVGIEGSPMSPPPSDPHPDYRMPTMMAKVALKDSKLMQDLQDAVGAALAGDPLSMTLTAVSETLLRMNSPVFSASYRFSVKDWREGTDAIIHVELAENRTGTVTAGGRGTEQVDLGLDLWWKQEGGLAPVQIILPSSGQGGGALQLVENARRSISYSGNDDRIEPCICVAGDSTTVEHRAYSAATVSDEGPASGIILVQPDGRFELMLQLGLLQGQSTGVFESSGCGEPPSTMDYAPAFVVGLGSVTVTGQLDLTKTSGEIVGSIAAAVPITVPATIGGIYAGGASQTPVDATATVTYAFSYTLTRIPVRMEAPALPRATASGPAVRAPAFTSWQRPLTAAALVCGGQGTMP